MRRVPPRRVSSATRALAALLGLALAACASPEQARAESERELRTLLEQRLALELPAEPEGGGLDEQQLALWLAEPLDEARALRVALARNPAVRARFAELGVSSAELVQAGLWRNPVLSLRAVFFDEGTELELDVLHSLLDLGWRSARMRTARAEHERTRLALAQELIALCSSVRRACVRARSAERVFALERDACAAARAAAELMHGLRSAGNVNATALAQLELEHARAERALAWAQAQRVQERALLQALLGSGVPSEGWTLANEVEPLAIELQGPAELGARAVQASLALEQERYEARAAAAALDLELAQARFGPGEFGLALQRRAEDGDWGIGPSLSLALPLSDTGSAARARGEARLAASLARGAALELELAASALQLGERARACAEQVRLLREHELVAAQSLVRARVRDYNAMQTGAFELLHARAQELASERALLEAQAQARLARIDLEELLAGGAQPAHASAARAGLQLAPPGMQHDGGQR